MQFISATTDSSRSRPAEKCPTRETAIIEHTKTVRILARQLQSRLPPCVTYDDLVSAGTIGLIQAVDRFQPSRGLKFTAFARHRILGAMLDFLRAEDPVSRTERQRIRLSERTGFSLPSERSAITLSLESLLPSQCPPSEPFHPCNQAARIIDRVDVRWARRYLSARENHVISRLYEQGFKSRDVARELHVNESRVSQIKSRAIAKLRIAFAHVIPAA